LTHIFSLFSIENTKIGKKLEYNSFTHIISLGSHGFFSSQQK